MQVFRLILLCLPAMLYAAPDGRWNVILISIDTLRADHLGCYGYRPAAGPPASPHIDALARESVVFENTYTPVPLTLPAHTSLLTGLYPTHHGVHDNGETLRPSIHTLAEAFSAGGYDTAAFIGSFILDQRFGLSRGFDEYGGEFDLHQHAGEDPGAVQIRGDHVEKAAEEWLTQPHSRPFFLFLHFYDLHGPFLLPSPWRERYRHDLYDGELAYVDGLVGALWTHLRTTGGAQRTILVITADHGEGLGEHGESNHGFFLYHTTTHIPLIVHFPDQRAAGKRIPAVVRLIDIAPTLIGAVGLKALQPMDGVSLMDAIDRNGRLDLGAYSETVYPFRHFHCAPLAAWTTREYSFIQAPREELYSNQADPAEARNLALKHPDIASGFREKLRPFVAGLRNEMSAPSSPEVLAKLKSLGYLAGGSATGGRLADPKDRIKLFAEYQDALLEEGAGHIEQAISGLEHVLTTDGAISGARIELGLARQRIHRDQDAAKDFRAALHVDPGNVLAHYDLAISLGNLHDDAGAIKEFDLTIALSPSYSRAYVGRGLAQARLGRVPAAIASLTAALKIDAKDFDALYNRGSLFGEAGQWDACRRDLTEAASIEPANAGVHVALGTLDVHLGDDRGALVEYQKAVALDPHSQPAHSGLGFLYRKMGDPAKAAAEMEKARELSRQR